MDESLIASETALHLEALYRIIVNDDITITPATFVILNSESNEAQTIWVRTVRFLMQF